MSKKKKYFLAAVLVLLALFLVSTQISLFVIQPIGAVPEGGTLVMLRGEGMKFIDSADAICLRRQGYVNLLCRGLVLAAVGRSVEDGKNKVLFTMPYSQTLYEMSTEGQTFEK